MSRVALLLLCGLLFVSATDLDIQNAFAGFVQTYGKNYKDAAELKYRFDVFNANLKRVADMNAMDSGATYGITQFMDLTPAEFAAKYLNAANAPSEDWPMAERAEIPRTFAAIPDSFDWRSKSGVLTPILNQGSCGSCWAFSAVETVESVWALAGHDLVALSEQQVVDCDKVNSGCQGGWPYRAYQYIMKAGGLEATSSYPYTARNGQCAFNPDKVVAKLSGWKYVSNTTAQEADLAPYVYAKSPVSICVDASSWQFYTSGVLATCGRSVNHCVQLTGFQNMAAKNGTTLPVWNVRNSWGTSWGVNGMIYFPRGQNMCLVATYATVPTV